MALYDLRNRAPKVEYLPDTRRRVTRTADVQVRDKFTSAQLLSELILAWGTADATYPECLLIKQDLVGQERNPTEAPNKNPAQFIQVFEQIDSALETAVGNPEVNIGQDDLTTVINSYLQFSTGTPVYGVPGTTLAPSPWSAAVLKTDERTDDGTLRRIKRTFITKGLIMQTDETKNGGKLLMRTLMTVGVVPTTPGGYTLIYAKVENPNGLQVYTYTYAKGAGRVSTDTQTKYLGALILTSIKYFNTDDGGTPAGVLIDTKLDQGDGYQIFDQTYASGSGVIDTKLETHNNGALLIQTIRAINAVPSNPGGYILIDADAQAQDGYTLYDYKFVKGNGVISTAIEYRLSPDQGTTGMTVTTIKYLSDPSIGSNPITTPSGAQLISVTVDDSDGHRIWTGMYAAGTGTISTEKEIRNNGKLVIYTLTAINAAPSAPSATIGGTVVLIGATQRNGTRFEDGTIIYEYKWAEGIGLISQKITIRTDGLREQTYVSLGTKQTPTPGIVILDESEEMEGVTRYTVTAMQSASGGDPTTATLTLPRRVPFTYPGRAKAYSATGTNGFTVVDMYFSPPVDTEVDANVAIVYQSSSSITYPSRRWQPLDGATVQAEWVGESNIPGFHIKAARGYRAIGTPISISVPIWAGTNGGTMLGNIIFGGTTAVLSVTGGPAAPDDGSAWTLDGKIELAFVDVAGTKYYRQTTIEAPSIPMQPILPV